MPSPQPVAPTAIQLGFPNREDPQPFLNEGEETTLCHRKPKHHLTMIPEDLKPISYRFHVVLAGEKADEFALAAVESEFALEHMQGQGKEHKHHGRSSLQSMSAGSLTSGQGSQQESGNEEFVFFCPCPSDDSECRELARLRLSTCISFTQSLPLSRDRAVARNLVVALLFWHVGSSEEATRDAISDYRTRLAEICHTPAHCRPYTTLLAFGATDEQRAQLENLVNMQKTVKVESSFFEDDAEANVVASLKRICERTIAHLSVTYTRSSASRAAALKDSAATSCRCVAM